MKKMILITFAILIVALLVISCSNGEREIQNPEDVPCNANNVGQSIFDGCNSCSCMEYEGEYGWSCTEKYCLFK